MQAPPSLWAREGLGSHRKMRPVPRGARLSKPEVCRQWPHWVRRSAGGASVSFAGGRLSPALFRPNRSAPFLNPRNFAVNRFRCPSGSNDRHFDAATGSKILPSTKALTWVNLINQAAGTDSRVAGWTTSRIAVHHATKILSERFRSGLPLCVKMAASSNRTDPQVLPIV
jgi:hypothetical protein